MILGLGKSPGEENGYQLQYSCLENPHGQRTLAGYNPWPVPYLIYVFIPYFILESLKVLLKGKQGWELLFLDMMLYKSLLNLGIKHRIKLSSPEVTQVRIFSSDIVIVYLY